MKIALYILSMHFAFISTFDCHAEIVVELEFVKHHPNGTKEKIKKLVSTFYNHRTTIYAPNLTYVDLVITPSNPQQKDLIMEFDIYHLEGGHKKPMAMPRVQTIFNQLAKIEKFKTNQTGQLDYALSFKASAQL